MQGEPRQIDPLPQLDRGVDFHLGKRSIAVAKALMPDEDDISPRTNPPLVQPLSTPKPVDMFEAATPSAGSVLLVDDNPVNLKILETYMKKQNYDYRLACNGLEALDAYKRTISSSTTEFHSGTSTPVQQVEEVALLKAKINGDPIHTLTSRPHLQNTRKKSFQTILMDISMPVMDGLESTRRIRALESAMNLEPAKIIALTALGSAAAQQEAYASGVDVFCMKPVKLGQLQGLLSRQ